MAGLTKRNGNYYVTWYANNKRYKRSLFTRNRREAERRLAKFEQEQNQGIDDRFTRHRKRPLVEHVNDYYAFQISKRITPKQANQVRMRLTRILDMARIRFISDLTESSITEAVSSLRILPQTKKKSTKKLPLASPRTRNGYLRAVLQFCNWLVRDRRMLNNPLVGMKEENEEVDLRHEREPLTEEQFRELHHTASTSQEIIEGYDGRTRAAIYLLAYATGLRRREMASLTPESFDLDPDAPTVTVEAAFSKHRRRDVIELPKVVVPLLEIGSVQPGERIFPRLGRRKTHKMLRLDLEAASISYRTEDGKFRDLHALRHAYITRVWQAGAAPNVARTLARHSDLRATMRYSHTRRHEQRSIVDRMNGFPKPPSMDDAEVLGEVDPGDARPPK
ncbi:Tyrosine recombinase XerC [Symmachiella dynata]|uniref:tyrosine-type recombinase/integrase n=1 Tax=Symmachiella dynata TaxID=2527995 RepID=UPI001189E6B3|nr:tyrosine-type recombinase/integrase [Symmachiella dynata]QDT50486.1 Tyrosine recombinase XerC [Symmachiella dynata]